MIEFWCDSNGPHSTSLLELFSPDLLAAYDEHTWLVPVRSLDGRQLGAFFRTCLEALLYQVLCSFNRCFQFPNTCF
jgi:hypothetical protein